MKALAAKVCQMFFRYIRLKKNTDNLPVQRELFNVLTLRQLHQTRNTGKISFVLELIKLYLIQSWERRIFSWQFFSRWKLQSIPIPISDKELNEADFLNSGPQIHFSPRLMFDFHWSCLRQYIFCFSHQSAMKMQIFCIGIVSAENTCCQEKQLLGSGQAKATLLITRSEK